MFLFYVLSFFKKGDIIQGRTLFKEIRYVLSMILFTQEISIAIMNVDINFTRQFFYEFVELTHNFLYCPIYIRQES